MTAQGLAHALAMRYGTAGAVEQVDRRILQSQVRGGHKLWHARRWTDVWIVLTTMHQRRPNV
jgi:hypothetical protein